MADDGIKTLGTLLTQANEASVVGELQAWEHPDRSYLTNEVLPAPELNLKALLRNEACIEAIENAALLCASSTDYVLGSLLVSLSAAASGRVKFQMHGGWTEEPIIWTLLLGDPSANKSPVHGLMTGCYAEASKLLVARGMEKLEEWESLPEEQQAETPKPHVPIPVVSNTTPEALHKLFASQPEGVLFSRDEGTGFLEDMTKYNSSSRGFWNETYNGTPPGAQLRIQRGTERPERLAASVFIGLQPEAARDLLLGTRNDGLMARFSPFFPEPKFVRAPRDVENKSALFVRAYRRIMGIMDTSEQGMDQRLILTADAMAYDLVQDHAELMYEWNKTADDRMKTILGKTKGIGIRIAGLITLFEWALSDETRVPYILTGETTERAFNFVREYLLYMAYRTYGIGQQSEEVDKGKKLLAYLKHKDQREFKSRDILQQNVASMKKIDELQPVLDVLVDALWLQAVKAPVGVKGGRAGVTYHVNPELFTC